MIISEIKSEIGHCSCDGAKFKATADFSHHAILLYDIVLKHHKKFDFALLSGRNIKESLHKSFLLSNVLY